MMLTLEVISAIYGGKIITIINWIKKGDVNCMDKEGRSAIFHAILAKSEKIVKLLLENKANVNVKDKLGWFPIHYAVQNYEMTIARLLIENDADIESKDDYGNTPLWRAAFSSRGKGEMIKLLISMGADKDNANDSDISPFQIANTIANYDVKQFFE